MRIDTPWGNIAYYRTVYADPPWKYGKGWGWGAEEYYPLMPLAAIKELPVSSIVTDNAHLYLWTPNSLIPIALEVMSDWGFKYKSVITWVKNRSIFGYYFKGQTEQLLFGVKGSMPVLDRCLTTVIDGRIMRHSQKPESAYQLIERASPTPRVELFARQTREGWDSWGLEIRE